jgi:hypothetical protein
MIRAANRDAWAVAALVALKGQSERPSMACAEVLTSSSQGTRDNRDRARRDGPRFPLPFRGPRSLFGGVLPGPRLLLPRF